MPLAVCATPIGNLEDITLRVLAALRESDLVLCEDTRRTIILLERHGIRARELRSYHEHNEAARVAEVLPRLRLGEHIALVSDAGVPGVNDPGGRLVREALAEGLPVTVLPGASAVVSALVASGFPAEQYRFVGYLPRREAALDALWAELTTWPHPVVAFESPKRLGTSLARLAVVAAERRVAVCRELTKLHEEVVVGAAAQLAERFADGTRGEVTLVLEGTVATPSDSSLEEAGAAVVRLISAGTPRRTAVDVVSALTGVSRNALYDISLDRSSE